VVQHRAARNPRRFRDQLRRGAAIAMSLQAVDGRFEDGDVGLGAFALLPLAALLIDPLGFEQRQNPNANVIHDHDPSKFPSTILRVPAPFA
jgi:hypothetical protein